MDCSQPCRLWLLAFLREAATSAEVRNCKVSLSPVGGCLRLLVVDGVLGSALLVATFLAGAFLVLGFSTSSTSMTSSASSSSILPHRHLLFDKCVLGLALNLSMSLRASSSGSMLSMLKLYLFNTGAFQSCQILPYP